MYVCMYVSYNIFHYYNSMYNKNSPVLNNRTRAEQINVSKLKRKKKSKATEDKKQPSVLDLILHFESHKSFHDFHSS